MVGVRIATEFRGQSWRDGKEDLGEKSQGDHPTMVLKIRQFRDSARKGTSVRKWHTMCFLVWRHENGQEAD